MRKEYRTMNIPNFNDIHFQDYIPNKTKLSNGIEVYSFGDNNMDVVFLKIVFYNAGSVFQDKFFTARCTQSQLSEDTKKYPSMVLAEKMDYYGIAVSRTVGLENTTLVFSFMKIYEKEALDLIEQILIYPLFHQDKLDVYINTAKQGYLAQCQKTSFLANREFNLNLFGENNPYGKYAQVEDFDKVRSEDLISFYNKYYTFNQCYIILAGNIDESLIKNIDSNLGSTDWNGNTAEKELKNILINTNTKAKTFYTNLDSAVQASIIMGKFFPSIKSEDYVPLKLLNCIFGGYFSSRLMTNIREQKGYTYGIDSSIYAIKQCSIFSIQADVTKGKDEQTIAEIYKEIAKLQQENVSKEELETAKHYMIGQILRNNDGVSEIADNYEGLKKFSLPEDYCSKMVERIKQTTSDEIRSLANKYLTTDNFVVSICKKLDKQ